ncbi:MAG TPA: hypothetical protein PLM71_02090 [Syntrophorhabdaceae bacterium]|nr:hypothetical protein [Syntrophorhabdaceae bacterium]
MRNGISWKVPLLTAMFLLISIPMFMVQSVRAQNDIDVSGIWRFKGQNKFHIEFIKKGAQLIATFVYDDEALKRDYGERLPFFTATLNGNKFNGRMDYYQSKGAIVTGRIKDSKTIEFIDGSRSGENVLYRE